MPGITDEKFMNINHILLLLYGYLSTAWAMDYSPCEDHNKWNDALNRYLPLEYREIRWANEKVNHRWLCLKSIKNV